MANSDKNIRITPNRNTTLFPKITFTGQSNNPITLNVLDDNSLSFEGSAGQLFSINNNLSSGYIFSINDISGLPSFRVNADGTVGIAEFFGNVGIGITNPAYKFQVRGDSYFASTGNTALLLLSGTGGTIIASNSVNITLTDPARKGLVINAANSQTANIFEWYADGGVGAGYSLAGRIRPSGHVNLGNTGTITMSTGTSALLSLQGRGSTEGLAIRGFNSAAFEPLFEIQGNPGNQLFGIYGDGGVNAPRINVTNGTASTSTSAGALIVTGGVGIGGSVNIGSALTVSGTTKLNSSLFNIPPTSSIIGGTSDSVNYGTYWTGYQVENGYLIYGRQVSGGSIIITELTGAQVGGTTNIFGEFLKHFKWGRDKYVVLASTGNSVLYSTSPVGAGSSWYYAALPTTASWQKLEYGNNRFVAIATGSTAAYSYDGITWSLSSLPASIAWSDIKYGNGVFVAGAGSTVAYSYDGIDWAIASNSVAASNLTYGNGFFFANATGNTASYSADGINWTNVTLPSDTHRGSAYGNGVFFNVGASSSNYISSDLINWTATANGVGSLSVPNSPWYVNNRFYYNQFAGSSGAFVAGPSGTLDLNPRFTGDINNVEIGGIKPAAAEFTTLAASGPVRFVSGLASTGFRNGSVVITGGVGIGGTLNVNNIGIGYTGIPYSPSIAFIGTTGDPIRLNVLSNNTLSFEGRSGQLFSINNNLSSGWIFSVNDISGIPLFRANADATISMAEYAGNVGIGLSNPTFKFQVAGSASIGATLNVNRLRVTSKITFEPGTGTSAVSGWTGIGLTSISKMIYAANRFVGVGGSYVAYSSDGVNFTYTTIPGQTSAASYGDIAYGNGVFVAVNVQNVTSTAYSYDGASWGTTSIGAGGNRTVVFGNGRFLAFSEVGNGVFSSADGRNWTNIGALGEYGREAIFANGYYLSARGANLYSSADGINWKRANTPGSNSIYAITYGKGIYLAADYNSAQYYTSTDLVTWTQRSIDNKVWTGASYVNGVFYLIPNNNNFLHHSLDGINWSTTNFGTPIGGINKLFTANDRLYFYSSWQSTLWSTDATTGTLMAKPFYNGELENTRIGAVNPDSATFTNLTALNPVTFTSATASTGADNGALVVTNGVGIGGTLNANTVNVVRDFNHTPNITTIGGASGWVASTASTFITPNTFRYLNNKYIGIGGTYIYYSDDMINWSSVMVPNLDPARNIANITYGEGKYVFVQYYTANAGYSTNLTNWTNVAIQYQTWNDVIYGNGRFVATTGNNIAAHSLDGTSWTSVTDSRALGFNTGLKFINGYFYVTNSNALSRSIDGITWQVCNTPAIPIGLAYGNGLYVGGVYNSGIIVYSYDGLNFSSYSGSSFVHNNSFFYNGVYYLTTNNNLVIRYSTDGFNWTNSTGFPGAVNNLQYIKGRLYAGSGNTVWVTNATPGRFEVNPLRTGTLDDVEIGRLSPNNANFIDVSVNNNLNVSSQYDSASYLDGALTVAGGVGIGKTVNVQGSVNISNSLNLVNTTTGIATTWTRTVVGTAATISYLAYANNLYVGVGYSSLTSTDGVNWTTRTLPNDLSFVSYGNGIWSGLLFNSALGATSTNGTSWTSYAMTNSRQWTMMAFGNGKFVTLARNTNIAAYSTNGYNWTEVTMPTNQIWVWVTYGGGYFVAVANGSATAVYSADGINWNITTLPSASGWNCITYGNGYYFATGSGNNGAYSKDLINWTNYPLNVNPGNGLFVSYNNGAFEVHDSPTTNSNIITGDFSTRTSVAIPFSQPSGQSAAGDRNFIAGYGQTFYTFPIPNNSITLFPNTTGEINNVEIGAVKPAAGNFSNIFSQGLVAIGATTRSTSPFNGSLTVSGGVGIGGTLNANSVVTYNRLQNQSFSGSSVGASDGRSLNYGILSGHDRISYGNGVFVTNSSWGAYNSAYSTDGINWTQSSLPVNQGYPVSMFGNGYFVLAATGATNVLYSTNGISWSQVSIGNTLYRSDGAYGNGKYVIVGGGETYNYSTNLTSWSTGTLPLTGDWRIAYGNGMFVAIAYGTRKIIYSYDGIYWNISNTQVIYALNITGITYANGRFIASTISGGGSAYSIDGINWYQAVGTAGENLNKVSYGNGVYFASSTGSYYLSGDGTTYSNSTPWSVMYEANNVAYGLGKFQAIGRWIDGPTNTVTLDPKFTGEINNVRIGAITPASGDFTNLSSTGAANLVGTVNANNLNILSKVNQTPVLGEFRGSSDYVSSTLLTGASNFALGFGNGLFISIRNGSNTIRFSSDGKRWTESTMPFVGSWFDVAWGNNRFVAVSSTGTTAAYSGNGISWTSMNMPSTASGWRAVTYGDDKFVAVGNTTTVAYSSNGISWSSSASALGETRWTGLAYGNGTFVTVAGYGYSSAYSYDGISWNHVNLPSNNTIGNRFITYGNGLFVVTNYSSNETNYSRDGINWTTSIHNPNIHTDIAYGNGVYSIFNYFNASFSYDGVNWNLSNSIDGTDWQAVAYGNNRFVATSINTGIVGSIDGPSNTLNLYPKFTGDIDNVRIGAKQPAAAEFTNLAAQQPVRFTANTPSTNTTNGALMVLGGVGIGGSLNIGSDVIINGGRESSSTSTGSLIVRGGVGITGGLYVSPFSSTGKGIVVASKASQSGNLFELQNSSLSTITSFNFLGDLNITSSTANTSATTGSIVTSGGVGIGGSVTINSLSQSTSTTNGALKVSGGVGISGNVNVGGSLNFSSSIFGGVSTSIVPTMTFIGQANDPITLSVLSDNSLSFDGSSGQLFSINNNLSTGWIFSISDISGLPLFRTNADGTVSMGEFGGNVGIGLTNPSYKLQVAGKASIGDTLFVTGNAHFGTTSYSDIFGTYYSSILTATDNFDGDLSVQIENKSSDLNARSGIFIKNDTAIDYFAMYLGSSNYAGIGQSSAFIDTFSYLDVNAGNGMVFRTGSGNIIDISGSSLTISQTTESTSATTGSLIINGGAGIAKSVNIGGFLSSKPAYASVGLAADQTILSTADTVLTMTDNVDPNNWWTGTAAIGVSHIFKPNIQGVYFVALQVHFKTGSGSGQMNIQARKNTNTFSLSQDVVNTVEGKTLNLTGTVTLNGSTDYIDFTAYTNATTSQVITGEGNRSFTQATIYKLF